MKQDWIRGKTIIVSGAGNGLGKYLTYNLITMYNCKVIGVDVDEIALSNLKTKIDEAGSNFEYFCFDAKNEVNWTKFASILNDEKIVVDILINCIGQTPKFDSFDKISYKETSQVMATNLYSCIFAIKSLYNNLKKSRTPSIINLCCSTINIAPVGSSVYSASKSALKCYTEVLQQELDDFYVGLFMLGLIKTDFWKNQSVVLQEKLNKRALSPQKVTEKIIKCIIGKKRRAVIGIDAYISDRLSRLMPYKAKVLFNRYLKKNKYRFIDDEQIKTEAK